MVAVTPAMLATSRIPTNYGVHWWLLFCLQNSEWRALGLSAYIFKQLRCIVRGHLVTEKRRGKRLSGRLS